jgi:starvation-inducible DNA-binding protein
MNELVESLKRLLANQFTMYLKAHGSHWNVEGPMFAMFHEFFQEIYEDVYSSIDPTAEDIRKLRQFPPFTLTELNKLRDVEDDKFSTDPIELSADLYAANEKVLESIMEAFDLASMLNEQGIANFLAERDNMHKKWRWQLKATLKQ